MLGHWALGIGHLLLMGCALCAALVGIAHDARAADEEAKPARLERLKFQDESKTEHVVAGRVLVEAVDGGLLVEGRDGRFWSIEKAQLAERTATAEAFTHLPADALGRQLQGELGAGFEVVATRHYVICSNAGKAYAQWCGVLFEVGSSRVDLQACKLEYSIVSPK